MLAYQIIYYLKVDVLGGGIRRFTKVFPSRELRDEVYYRIVTSNPRIVGLVELKTVRQP